MALEMVGYWGDGQWVNPEDLVDETWSKDERDDVIYYLLRGFHFRAYMIYATVLAFLPLPLLGRLGTAGRESGT